MTGGERREGREEMRIDKGCEERRRERSDVKEK